MTVALRIGRILVTGQVPGTMLDQLIERGEIVAPRTRPSLGLQMIVRFPYDET